MKDNYVVIMAGGIGSRFWPMSKSSFPKQFHDILGVGKTLLQITVDRFKNICPQENIYIVTNTSYKSLINEQVPFIKHSQILLEPCRKNTAPCIAYAAYKIINRNPSAKMIIAPSDHLILNQKTFEKTIKTALDQAQLGNYLITLGIKPSRPDTGYGYIQYKEGFKGINSQVKKVKTFTEKPPKEIAVEFLKSGDFYWNSGMFIWNANSIVTAFEHFLPQLHNLFSKSSDAFYTKNEIKKINNIYPQCENISIDKGIMEKADNVLVVLADLGWSDLGTWGSLFENLKKDPNQNAVIGKKVMLYDSDNNIISVPNEKLVLIQGLSNYIVVENENMLLICKKADEQKIKSFVHDIKLKYGEENI